MCRKESSEKVLKTLLTTYFPENLQDITFQINFDPQMKPLDVDTALFFRLQFVDPWLFGLAGVCCRPPWCVDGSLQSIQTRSGRLGKRGPAGVSRQRALPQLSKTWVTHRCVNGQKSVQKNCQLLMKPSCSQTFKLNNYFKISKGIKSIALHHLLYRFHYFRNIIPTAELLDSKAGSL